MTNTWNYAQSDILVASTFVRQAAAEVKENVRHLQQFCYVDYVLPPMSQIQAQKYHSTRAYTNILTPALAQPEP
ncbi:hypothetical protein DUNSADRAFT_17498 [Dunaliella salina]|uniref:Uncharacterized protein n=1 Tax=Dunaliella salina TaxID=3046 RepID=A0ABQ7G1L5_DUNSA|nr:hypothetical protein DUNSADRAFT_17498 [Dunaliella salina]|eukprot:KAF5828501.1 hypothetical protein DUNSADRAFT_17498 [Dunaliella salina]